MHIEIHNPEVHGLHVCVRTGTRVPVAFLHFTRGVPVLKYTVYNSNMYSSTYTCTYTSKVYSRIPVEHALACIAIAIPWHRVTGSQWHGLTCVDDHDE